MDQPEYQGDFSNFKPPSSSSFSTQTPKNQLSIEQSTPTNKTTGKKQQMVYQANLSLKVSKLELAKAELDKIAKQTDARLVSSSDTTSTDERNIRITYQVPQQKFQLFLAYSKKISDTAPDIQIYVEDVSEELVDLSARIQSKKAMEARLLTMMNKAVTIDELLNIENTLGNVQEQIEQLVGKQQYLQHRVAFSTVTVELRSTTYPIVQTHYSVTNQIARGFMDSCKNLWTGLQLFIIWFAKVLPYLLLIIIISFPIIQLIKRRQKK